MVILKRIVLLSICVDHSTQNLIEKNITEYLSPINQSIIIICLLYQKYDGQKIDG